jgi:hypothetical protein
MRCLYIGLMFFLLLPSIIYGRADSVVVYGSVQGVAAQDAPLPHWLVANRYGIFDQLVQNDAVVTAGIWLPFSLGKHFWLEGSAELLTGTPVSDTRLQQIFINLHYGKFQLKLGKEQYTLNQYSETLSSGSFYLSNNAAPIPRVGGGFYEYTSLPFTQGFVQFKGILQFGRFDDDRLAIGGVDKPLFHEKFFYIKTDKLPLNLHLGLNHNAMFGGTRSDGSKIPIDLLPTVFARGSSKLGGGEQLNRAGAHFGLYDFGLSWQALQHNFQWYYQIPFADGSGSRFVRNGDKVVGLLISGRRLPWLSAFNYEYIQTQNQSGSGLPDPLVDGEFVDVGAIGDYDQAMFAMFDTLTTGITRESFMHYLEENYNYGYSYGGRDDYYNNYLYPAGLSYRGYSIGTPLFFTRNRLQKMNERFDGQYDHYFVSNRVQAHHVGWEGAIAKGLTYRALLTFSSHRGTYTGANKGRYNWASMSEPDYDYFFDEEKQQSQTLLELMYAPAYLPAWQLTAALAYDFGDIYHNYGAMLGVRYRQSFRFKKRD